MIKQFFKIFNAFTPAEKKCFFALLAVFAGASLGWSTLAFENNTEAAPIRGGEYKEGTTGQPTFINPVISGVNDIDRDIAALIYLPLSDLIEGFQADANNKTFIVKIREDLIWQDGMPLTSDDVVFTIQTIQNEETNSPLKKSWQGVAVERISEIQLRFALRNPYVFFQDGLDRLPIIPQHIFGNVPPSNLKLSRYNLEPIGSGPYKFSKFIKKRDGFITEYQLVRNEKYSGEKPLLDKITFKFYENENDLLRAFNQKEINVIAGAKPSSLEKITLRYDLKRIRMPSYYAVFLNQNLNPDLKNKNIRHALIQAVNKEEIIERVFSGMASEVAGPLVSGFPGYDGASLASVEYDPEMAAETIKDLGKQLNFSLIVPDIDFLVKTGEIIKKDWQQIGVNLELIILPPNDIISELFKSRNYELILFGNALQRNPDIYSFWHSSERFFPGLNLAAYSNGKVDQLLEDIRKTFDAEERQKKISTLQGIISQDMPAVFLYSPDYLFVTNKIKGLDEETLALPADRFNNIEKYYAKTARVFK